MFIFHKTLKPVPDPPVGFTNAEPSFKPKQLTLIVERFTSIEFGSPTTAIAEFVHPFASVTIHVYDPDDNPVAI